MNRRDAETQRIFQNDTVLISLRLCVSAVFIIGVLASGVRADCNWPPLNATEESDSNTVEVGGAAFSTGYFSWHVPSYRIDALRCVKSVDVGPRHWWVIISEGKVRSGRDKPSRAQPSRAQQQRTPRTPSALAALPDLVNVPDLENIGDLERMPDVPALAASLPEMAALPPLE